VFLINGVLVEKKGKEKEMRSVEARKKLNFGARFFITMVIVFTFLFLVYLLFYKELPPTSRDLINIMVGAYVAVLAKATDYWFKDKDDPEHKESESLNGNNT
jgi:amino acid transporter|tara:strand:- start:2081 stop:2386 length:306 start_codon:yes stop_codon:yes gene_type:complete